MLAALCGLVVELALAPQEGEVRELKSWAAEVGSYTWTARLKLEGAAAQLPEQAPVTGHYVRGQPVHLVQGAVEAFVKQYIVVFRREKEPWCWIDLEIKLPKPGASDQGGAKPAGPDHPRSKAGHGDLPTQLVAIHLYHSIPPHEVFAGLDQILENISVQDRDGVRVLAGTITKEWLGKLKVHGSLLGVNLRRGERQVRGEMRIALRPDGGEPRRCEMRIDIESGSTIPPVKVTSHLTVELSHVGETVVDVPAEAAELLAD
ncbi:MAG: hypothetical protein AB1486_17845 [Planctomycetota bacterium]